MKAALDARKKRGRPVYDDDTEEDAEGDAEGDAADVEFEIAVEAIAQYGLGLKPPSYHELREPFLGKCVKETHGEKKRHEDAWTQYGCTLMSDGWTDRRGHQLINFLVNSPAGTFFLESVDASNESHDAMMLADLLDQIIEKIGRDKVVQIVTDNGANYKAAGRYLVERTATLFWTPCAAHCLDLMLEDIGKLKDFAKPITRAHHITTFIYRHGRILSEMRVFTKGMDLVRMAATRFATAFLTLRCLHKHKDALRALFSGDVFTRSKVAKTEAGKKNSVEDCLRASLPLLVVLRLVDGDEKPAMPEVAAAMNIAKQKISSSFSTQNKKALLNCIMKIVENHWVKQMDTPLYGAALYLNPGKFYKMKQSDDDGYVGELRGCFNDVLVKMVTDEDLRDKIDGQAVLYENQRESFANPMAIRNAQTRNPLDWWLAYGGRTVELYKFARRIIHTKKRSRLEHERLNNLVYVQYNRKMAARFQKMREEGKNIDPLVLEDFDWDNEWVDPLANSGHIGGDPLFTWHHVDEAAGASTQLRGRNFPRRAHVSRFDEDEDGHGDEAVNDNAAFDDLDDSFS
ncbi:hypothetical protein BS78_03G168500 [Paspalum vaginatum]|nr:hypothetical protein BS78_03G168500 [Paspalum vaginatum]